MHMRCPCVHMRCTCVQPVSWYPCTCVALRPRATIGLQQSAPPLICSLFPPDPPLALNSVNNAEITECSRWFSRYSLPFLVTRCHVQTIMKLRLIHALCLARLMAHAPFPPCCRVCGRISLPSSKCTILPHRCLHCKCWCLPSLVHHPAPPLPSLQVLVSPLTCAPSCPTAAFTASAGVSPHLCTIPRRPRPLLQAPLCEEWVFRACMAPLLRGAGYSVLATVFVAPLFFSVAHLHHVHELMTYQGFPLAQALLSVRPTNACVWVRAMQSHMLAGQLQYHE